MLDPNESTQANPDEGGVATQGQEGQQHQTQEQIDWEAEHNPYKKRYADSQGQVTPLVRTLQQFAEYDHNTKTWKPKTQAPQTQEQAPDVDKLLEGYDPEFVKVLKGTLNPLQKRLEKFEKDQEQSVSMNNYNSKVTEARSRTISEFGNEYEFSKEGKMNSNSPLYKLANEILTSKYAEFNPDGTFHKYTSTEAEYLATVEAYALLSKRAKQPAVDNQRLNAIQGKGSKSSSVGKNLSFEEYNKLSSEQKDAYDAKQMA